MEEKGGGRKGRKENRRAAEFAEETRRKLFKH